MSTEGSVKGAVVEPAPEAKPAGPCAMVIFGAGGGLTKRLVVPALYNLTTNKLLPENFALIGLENAHSTTDQWRDNLSKIMQRFLVGGPEFTPESIHRNAWDWLLGK